jgi:hypothetical protein
LSTASVPSRPVRRLPILEVDVPEYAGHPAQTWVMTEAWWAATTRSPGLGSMTILVTSTCRSAVAALNSAGSFEGGTVTGIGATAEAAAGAGGGAPDRLSVLTGRELTGVAIPDTVGADQTAGYHQIDNVPARGAERSGAPGPRPGRRRAHRMRQRADTSTPAPRRRRAMATLRGHPTCGPGRRPPRHL